MTAIVISERDFNDLIVDQIEVCKSMMVGKAQEYAADDDCVIRDRLHNFHLASAISGRNELQSAAGMMVKHTTSIYDLIAQSETTPMTDKQRMLWIEKITDHINYLLILRVLVEEKYRTTKLETRKEPNVPAPEEKKETTMKEVINRIRNGK